MRSRMFAVEDAQQDVEAEITCRGSRRTLIERDALSSLGGGYNLMSVRAFIMAYLMWRNGSRGRIRRSRSATRHVRPR